MDDRKVYELKRLELAYQKQLQFLRGLMIVALIGLIVYIINIYQYNQALLITSVMLVITGGIGMLTIDQKMKLISGKIKKL